MSGKLKRFIEAVGSKPFTMSGLASKLDIEENEVRDLLDILLSMGYVRELRGECIGCEGSFCRDCPVRDAQSPMPRTYILTKKVAGIGDMSLP